MNFFGKQKTILNERTKEGITPNFRDFKKELKRLFENYTANEYMAKLSMLDKNDYYGEIRSMRANLAWCTNYRHEIFCTVLLIVQRTEKSYEAKIK